MKTSESDVSNKRLLVISYFYPPANSLPSQRVSKFTKYLYRWGWEPHVLTIGPQKSLINDMPFEIPEKFIHATGRWDFDRFVAYAFEHREKNKTGKIARPTNVKRIAEFLRGFGQKTIIPDGKIGWYPFAVRYGRELIEKLSPSIILAVGGPYTGFLIASKLSAQYGIPWVADILDPWADNYSIRKFPPFSFLNARMEKSTLSTCSKIVVVTEPWAAQLREKYGDRIVEVVCNAYDDEDFALENEEMQRDQKITIVYTGYLYKRQLPEVFFVSLRRFLDDCPEAQVAVEFYGPMYPSVFFHYVKKYRLEDFIFYCGQVSYMEAIHHQKKADVLLLFTWGAKGVLLAKALSYLGAGRPILSVGPENDTTADFIKNNRLGLASNESSRIREFLAETFIEKKRFGRVSPIEGEACLKSYFTYRNQAKRLSAVLEEVAAAGA